MPYINEQGGRLNNFAVEPKVYTAEPPTNSQKRNYIIGGLAGIALVGVLLFLAFTVS
ncbi:MULTISPECIES: photosystem II assembly protein Psb34 [Planktothrix]|uniref:Ssl1498 family light-harvesting-like protein n=1 Tax=Planktothrix rubescens CCAP 1459/22 TaxID=329571 RepID=A0A6J7ZFS3_PLARU|nr:MULTISPECIES: ssl1498 family light-harvesting-like protein [Planktothrix]CAH2572716.1 hypothetical protein PRNO82_02123 [Planktothrix rubescens]CAC5340244.1 conserved hypothetical protein [Planktothrix rubescens NIVA-CYA 18]CAD0231278.1 conserved hypothetical protein [Planktothrix agardhii]CAD5945089.1 hypothetical protein PCC7821_02163 [Planktothrix rubescens NIVA-CYA 18]CAD5946599.1 hypothetical protein NO758_02263 [Planktothrix agardhii]